VHGGLVRSGVPFLRACLQTKPVLAPWLIFPQTITNIRNDFEPPTMALQNTWRFIPFAGAALYALPGQSWHAAVGKPPLQQQQQQQGASLPAMPLPHPAQPSKALHTCACTRHGTLPYAPPPPAVLFGVLIVLTPLTALAIWFMTWPKTAAFLTALLWLVIALLMLVGTGKRCIREGRGALQWAGWSRRAGAGRGGGARGGVGWWGPEYEQGGSCKQGPAQAASSALCCAPLHQKRPTASLLPRCN